jgi:Fe-S cluster assembly ATP-binding protein
MLKISGLSVTVGQKPILNNLNLVIEPGTVHALMGPNGSGKSTLAYTLMGHPQYQITAGGIEVCDEDITTLSPEKRAQKGIFLAFQMPVEIPGVTIATFLKEAHRAVTGLQLSVAEFNVLLQEKMALLQIDPGWAYRNLNEGFSGGEKKRLEMLQMLVLNPSIIIVDEIDSGLDIDALKIVAQAIAHMRASNPSVCILIITHYQRLLDHLIPDQVHIVAHGAIVQSGTAALAQALEHKGYDGIIAN